MKKVIFIVVLMPLFALAQGGELVVGERTVSYDSSTSTDAGTLYYAGDNMVASENGAVMLVFENDQLILEAHDTNGDGVLDAFLTLDSSDEVVSMTGEGASVFERPEVKEFSELMAERGAGSAGAPDEQDLVGSVDSISIPRYQNYTLYLWLVLIAGGGYWYYRKRQQKGE